MIFTRRLAVMAALLIVIAPAAALAHPTVLKRTPAANSKVKASPKEVRVTFNNPVFTYVTDIDITGPGGKRVATGPLASADGGRTIILPILTRLAPGDYAVSWTIQEPEHDVPGLYRFTVTP